MAVFPRNSGEYLVPDSTSLLVYLVIRQLKKRPEGAEKETFKEVAENRKEKAEVPEEQSLKRAAPVVKAPKQEQTVKKKMEKERSPSVSEELNEAEKVARNWYIMEGREKFHHISMKLASEGVNSFSIGKDGLCSIRTEKGFRRVAAIRDFPAQKMLVIKKELEKEGIYYVKLSGRYMWVTRRE
ncbi:hypothetical protein DW994_11020 [Mediterraneibacter gnavus]|nr:hypothetical protein DW994_11020 [Mediterraneibacter gnavus]